MSLQAPASSLVIAPVQTGSANVEAVGIVARSAWNRVCAPAVLIGLHAIIWAAYATLSESNGLHHDMLEAYSWGREFLWGYYKHPPLWSWIAALWFEVLPRADWAFYLLSSLNASLGLFGVWLLTGQFCSGRTRQAAIWLLLLMPFFNFYPLRFNANTMLLSLWPWTLYFFVRSMHERSWQSGLWFGILAGLGLLSKYYTLLLLVSCFGASLMHQQRVAYYRSAAPWAAMAVCTALFTPHIIWLFQNGFQPFEYAMSRTNYSSATLINSAIIFIIACLNFHGIPILMIGLARYFGVPGGLRSITSVWKRRQDVLFLGTLALGPLLLTLIAGTLGHTRLSPLFATPIFCLTPLLLILVLDPPIQPLLKWTKILYIVIMTGSLLAAPFIPFMSLRWGEATHQEPRAQLDKAAEKFWYKAVNSPLRIVAGTWPYSGNLVFHSADPVSHFDNFDWRWSPWVTPDRIARDGLLILCQQSDTFCLEKAALFSTPTTRRQDIALSRKIWGYQGATYNFRLFAISPEIYPENTGE